MIAYKYIASSRGIGEKSVKNTLELMEDGCTIPFIARYRKERTGGLDEVALAEIAEAKNAYDAIVSRKSTILKAIEEQGALTPELKNKIDATMDLVTLEDLYLPYKKKRLTKAEAARKKGLEPLAKIIMGQRSSHIESEAGRFINSELGSIQDAIQGAQYIIAEWINERSDIRSRLRKSFEGYAVILSKVVTKHKDTPEAQTYRDYFDWEESIKRCPSHRVLAILRGEKEGFLRVKIAIDDERAVSFIESRIIRNAGASADIIKKAIADSYKRLLYPSLANERLTALKKSADEEAIKIFAENLRQLLLASPLGQKRILAIDPGFRTGCKAVCLDAEGNLLYNTAVFPHPPQKRKDEAIAAIEHMVHAYKVEAIAIGNGTASRETEDVVRSCGFGKEVEIYVVSEAGASIYSASEVARTELPDHDVTVRGAVSIGRRLADPLAELVKIDAKSIGVGQYQHDVDQSLLKTSLDRVVENCVNRIGVNLNTASPSLLRYVSGLGEKIASNIVQYRKEHGPFRRREDIKKVPRLGAKAYEQCVAFLRIKGAENPLDDSAVHPESYGVVRHILKEEGLELKDVIGEKHVLDSIDLNRYVNDKVGLMTLRDIKKELEKPGVDMRSKAKPFAFDASIKSIEDLREGAILPGIVNNITAFGCFVDIGIKESGLVHISNLSDSFVKDVNEHVRLQQQISVKVIGVDLDRKRIQLAKV